MNKAKRHTKKLKNLLLQPTSGSPSIKMNTEVQNSLSPTKQEAIQLSGMFHQSCKTIPISCMFEIMITRDLSWLIIKGDPMPFQLEEAWNIILEEYVSLIKTEKTDDIFLLYKKIKQTMFLRDIIELSLNYLTSNYDEDIAKLVSEKGFGIIEYTEDKEVYSRMIKSVRMSAKTLIILLNQYNTEYALTNKGDQVIEEDITETAKRLRIEKELATLSRFQGQRINKQTTTALEYAAIINNYLDYNKVKQDGQATL